MHIQNYNMADKWLILKSVSIINLGLHNVSLSVFEVE